ncbi:MAG TPA: fibrobacter succinogenes major paralogous domain-containing protein, partial [Bacteroidales bacterium]|nr:fibrobacter succinogenes major paralogous domain-containing protein [Bacteroidales bacterium]
TSSPSLDITGETEPKYQWPAGGVETNVPEYGRLYSWYTVTDNRKICPSGWHVPSTAEWEGLGSFLKDKGGYLKETGLTHWMAPNYGATNSSNFTARGAGYRLLSSFENMKNYAMFWTTTPSSSASAAPYVYLYYDYDVLGISYSPPSSYSSSNGFSVRCLKDN